VPHTIDDRHRRCRQALWVELLHFELEAEEAHELGHRSLGIEH